MYLSDYFLQNQILHDCEFCALGLSNSGVNERMLSFLEDRRFAAELLNNPCIAAVICKPEDGEWLAQYKEGVVLSETPRCTYFELHNHLAEMPDYCSPLAPSVIPANCQISPLAYIASEGVEFGDHVVIEEFVSIKGPCRVGANTIIHAGAKVGGEGFEFKRLPGTVLDVVHCGSVEIGENVIIWENATIHKAVYPWDVTRVGNYARVGANSHIDHGAKLGAFAEVCASAIISGRVEVGDRAFIGPGAVVSNRISIGEGAKISLGGVVTKDVPAGQTVSGNFAVSHEKHLAFLRKIR